MAVFFCGTLKGAHMAEKVEVKKDPYQEIIDKNTPVEHLTDEEIDVMAAKAREELAKK
jgi:hypothetical protein